MFSCLEDSWFEVKERIRFPGSPQEYIPLHSFRRDSCHKTPGTPYSSTYFVKRQLPVCLLHVFITDFYRKEGASSRIREWSASLLLALLWKRNHFKPCTFHTYFLLSIIWSQLEFNILQWNRKRGKWKWIHKPDIWPPCSIQKNRWDICKTFFQTLDAIFSYKRVFFTNVQKANIIAFSNTIFLAPILSVKNTLFTFFSFFPSLHA